MNVPLKKTPTPLICLHCGAENNYQTNSIACIQCGQDLAMSPRKRNRFLKRFLFFAGVLLLLVYLLNRNVNILHTGDDYGRLIYGIIMIVIVSSALSSGKLVENMSYLGIWVVIFLLSLGVYTYRHELSAIKTRMITELIPSKGFQGSPESVSFPASSDGHFYAQADINGVIIEFLADTGASHIVLSPDDARKIGLNPATLRYDRFYETANGTVRGSSIRLSDFKVGRIHLKDTPASINEAPMRNSLLGMTFFKKLSRYEVKNQALTLYWQP